MQARRNLSQTFPGVTVKHGGSFSMVPLKTGLSAVRQLSKERSVSDEVILSFTQVVRASCCWRGEGGCRHVAVRRMAPSRRGLSPWASDVAAVPKRSTFLFVHRHFARLPALLVGSPLCPSCACHWMLDSALTLSIFLFISSLASDFFLTCRISCSACKKVCFRFPISEAMLLI